MKQLISSLRTAGSVALLTFGALHGPLGMAQGTPPSGAADTAAAAIPKGPGSLQGIWINAQYKGTGQAPAADRNIRTVDGKTPPLLPWAAALLQKRIKEADDDGEIFSNTLTECLPGGIPQMLEGAAYPIQVIESPGQVSMLFEEQNHFRLIFLNGTLPKDPDPAYWGYSVGHWEGDTLVVETVGQNDKTTLDMVGTPHTEKMRLTERYRRVAANRLEVLITVDDPGAFSAPWQTKVVWRAAPPGTHVGEYICENNRNAPDAEGHTSFGPPSSK